MHATCSAYVELMARLAHETYAVQAMAAWAIEYAYNEVHIHGMAVTQH